MNRSASDPSAQSPWAITYHGPVELETAVAVIESVCQDAGLCCQRQDAGPDAVRIAAVQQQNWFCIIFQGLPQRLDWQLERNAEEVQITAEFRPFRWYLALLIFMVLMVVMGLIGMAWLTARPGWTVASGLLVGMPVLLLTLIATVRLFGALGGGVQASKIWSRILAQVARKNAYLLPIRFGVSRAHEWALISYAVLIAGFGLWLAGSTFWDGMLAGKTFAIVLTALLLGAYILILCALLMLRQQSFGFRITPLLAGGTTSVAMLILLFVPWLWSIPSFIPPNLFLPFLTTHEPFLSGQHFIQKLQEVPWERLNPHLAQQFIAFRHWCALLIGAVAVTVVLGGLLFLYGTYTGLRAWPSLWWLQRHREQEIYRRALSGSAVVRSLRWIFLPFWAILAGMLLASLGFALLAGWQAAIPTFAAEAFRLPELSTGLINVALGRPVNDSTITLSVRLGWIFYGLLVLQLWLISTGQLFFSQRFLRARLQRLAANVDPHRLKLQQQVDSLAIESGLGNVRAVISSELSLNLSSVIFGGFRPERYVIVAHDAFTYLSWPHLQALVAHELAHHQAGHCRYDQWLRWLGRLTFVGDGFVLALQNSWSYELTADEIARKRFKMPHEQLVEALQVLRSLRDITRRQGQPRLGLAADAAGETRADLAIRLANDFGAIPFQERWALAFRLFADQYFHALELHYWHPPLVERAASDGSSGLTPSGDACRP